MENSTSIHRDSKETEETVSPKVAQHVIVTSCSLQDVKTEQISLETFAEQGQVSSLQSETIAYPDTSIQIDDNEKLRNAVEQQQQSNQVECNTERENTSSEDKENAGILEKDGDVWIDFIQVPKEAVGFIIGKGGETIKELGIKSGAHIEVERRDTDALSSSRLFRIQGTTNNIQVAKQLILEKVAGVLVGQSVSSVTSSGSIQSELWIPMDRVGVMIGVGGQTIKSLEEQSQATIVVHNDKVNAMGEKLVTIVGKPQEVHIAETLIQEIIEKPSRAMNTNNNNNAALFSTVMGQTSYAGFVSPELSYMSRANLRPMTNKTIFVPRKSIGMIIGKRGETIRDLQYRSGASIRVVPDNEVSMNSVERPIILSGSIESVELAHNLINDIVNEGIERLGGDISEAKTLYPSASISLRIQIPNDKVGWIIGKSGSTIRELQQRSGARIQVSKPSETDSNTNTRPVTITGPPPFVEIAKQLISEKLAGYYIRQGGYPQVNRTPRRPEQESELPIAAFGSPVVPHSTHLLNYTYEMNPYASSFDPTIYYPMYGVIYPPTATSFPAMPTIDISQDTSRASNVPESVDETTQPSIISSSSPFPT